MKGSKKPLIDQLPDPVETDLFDAYDLHYRFDKLDLISLKTVLNELITWTSKKLSLKPLTIEISEASNFTDATLYFASENDMVAFLSNPVVRIYAHRKIQKEFPPKSGPQTSDAAGKNLTQQRGAKCVPTHCGD